MDFIFEIPNHLPKELCEKMIESFEKDDRKSAGRSGTSGQISNVKKSIDLNISGLSGWEDVDKQLHIKLGEGIDLYRKHLQKMGVDSMEHSFDKCNDRGYQIQKTTKGEYYGWHNDERFSQNRFITFIWYLNDLHPVYDGGGTAFHPSGCNDGKIITPEQGKLIMFPATWTYIHAGLPVVSDIKKYLCTGWLCSENA